MNLWVSIVLSAWPPLTSNELVGISLFPEEVVIYICYHFGGMGYHKHMFHMFGPYADLSNVPFTSQRRKVVFFMQ